MYRKQRACRSRSENWMLILFIGLKMISDMNREIVMMPCYWDIRVSHITVLFCHILFQNMRLRRE